MKVITLLMLLAGIGISGSFENSAGSYDSGREPAHSKKNILTGAEQTEKYLPYLKGRPQSLNRFPNGIYGKSFYQKDVTGKVPEWATTYLYHASEHNTSVLHPKIHRL